MGSSSGIERLFDKELIRGNTIFHELAEIGSLDILHRIYHNVKEPCRSILNVKNYNGDCCTHIAVRNNRGSRAIKIVDILVKLGADLNACNLFAGSTILHESVLSDDYSMVAWLCQQPGIKFDLITWGHQSAYQIAARKKNKRMMLILSNHGACPEDPISSESETDV